MSLGLFQFREKTREEDTVRQSFKICMHRMKKVDRKIPSPEYTETQRHATNQMTNKFRMNKKKYFFEVFIFHLYPWLKEFTTNTMMAMSLDGFKRGLDKLMVERCINQ